MKFRCPSCSFTGIIRVPDYFPRGKKVAVNCTKCNYKFGLTTGKLWPQDSKAAYRALMAETIDCKGEIIGNLWVEIIGTANNSPPIFVFPSDLAFPHEIMHDLIDPLTDYNRICYIEFPGTRRNPAANTGNGYFQSFEMIMDRLRATEFYLLAHKSSCSLALSTAAHFGREVCSALILIEPEISGSPLRRAAQNDPGLFSYLEKYSPGNEPADGSREEILFSILSEYNSSGLAENHSRGLAGIMAPGLSVELMASELKQPENKLSYRKLAGIEAPAQILTAAANTGEAGPDRAQQQAIDDIYFIDSSIPQAEIERTEQRGDWGCWFSVESFTARVSSFIQRAKNRKNEADSSLNRTISRLPVGWLTAASILLIWGLSFLLHGVTYVPEYMRSVVPVAVGSLLPLASFMLPRKLNLFKLQRFSNFNSGRILLAAAAGLFLGVSWAGLLLVLKGTAFSPPAIPAFLLSLPAGTQGRIFLFMAILPLQLLLFGVLENILIIRRSPVKILLPALLFSLMPLSFPDLIWQLPLGAASACLMYRQLSSYSPLTLLLGFALSSELLLKQFNLNWSSLVLTAASASFFLLFLLTVFLQPVPSSGGPPARYYTAYLLRDGKHFPWRFSRGIFISLLAMIASVILIVGFLRA